MVKFWNAFYYFKYAPVFRYNNITNKITLEPLNRIIDTNRMCSNLIGYDPMQCFARETSLWITDVNSLIENFSAIYCADKWFKTGNDPIMNLLKPPKNDKNEDLPRDAVIDFTVTPWELQPTSHILSWFNSRGIGLRKNIDIEALKIKLGKIVTENLIDSYPVQSKEMLDTQIGRGHYISWEVLSSQQPLQWIKAESDLFYL